MAVESERQEKFFDKARDVVASVAGKGYLGGELQAAFRQGFGELGAAFGKAFPDSIQHEEPGTVFNPLYRDMPGNPQSQSTGPEPANARLPTPSEIARGADSLHGEARQPGKDLPTPSEIAKDTQPNQPEQEQGREHGQERGGRGM
jgi:hypothetical protein